MNFGYKPEAAKAGRAAAVEKWRGWCQGVCGAKPEVVAPVAAGARCHRSRPPIGTARLDAVPEGGVGNR